MTNPDPDQDATKTWATETSAQIDTTTGGSLGEIEPQLSIDYLNKCLAGQYRIRGVLGSGGMGTVYRAEGVKLKREVAIKAIHAVGRMSKAVSQLLREEAKIVASLAHPNIKQVYDVLEVDHWPLIVMEYTEGMDLAQATKTRKLTREDLLKIIITICDAVGFAHAHSVIHRDIKPSNIMLTENHVPKLADFGIALRQTPDDGVPSTEKAPRLEILGSPAFMAPEQARGRVDLIDSRTDIYALGATLYYGLTGKPPFRGTPEEIIDQLLHSQVRAPSRYADIDQDLDAICLKCTRKNPSERYRTAYMLADDLRAYLDNSPITVRRYNPLEKIRRAIGKRPYTFAFAVGISFAMFGSTFLAQYVHNKVARRSVIGELQEKVRGIAHTAAMLVSPSYVEAVHTSDDVDSPECQTLSSILREIRVRNSDIESVSVVRRSTVPGYVEFVVDDRLSDPPEELDRNKNGFVDPDEEPAVPGELYTDTLDRPKLLRGFLAATGETREENAWHGNIGLAGYAPIFDVNGESIAVLWVTMKTGRVEESLRQIEQAYHGAVGLLSVIYLSLLILIILWTVGLWERGYQVTKESRFKRLRARY